MILLVCPNKMTEYINYTSFSDFLTPLIAIIAAYIAYQQYRINKQRFLFETYEKRLKVYNAVQDFLINIRMHGKTTNDNLFQFNRDTSEVIFLFDKTIKNKIDELFNKAIEMIELDEMLYPSDGSDGLPVGDERTKIAKEKSVYNKWFGNQIDITKKLFSKKMSLK